MYKDVGDTMPFSFERREADSPLPEDSSIEVDEVTTQLNVFHPTPLLPRVTITALRNLRVMDVLLLPFLDDAK